MRNFVYFFIVCLVLTGCKYKTKHREVLTSRIDYNVLINNPDIDKKYWVQNIEGAKRYEMYDRFKQAALNNNSLYDCYNNNIISKELINKMFQANDTARISFNYKLLNHLRFSEKWLYNASKGDFEKIVYSLGFVKTIDSSLFPLFCIRFDTNFVDEKKYILIDKIQYDVFIKNPENNFEWYEQNIENPGRIKYVETLIKNVLGGKIKLYDYFNESLSAEKFKKEHYFSDTLTFQNPNPPFNNYDTIFNHSLEIENIVKLRFLEEWSIGEKSGKFYKRVLGINPMLVKYNENGEIKGYMPLFWIYFDKSLPGRIKT
ncbi:MAG: hypothetical protein KA792_04625 [Bacteroidales bacterium]|nr:hypothetical protein [Bacteroidales bacterium]